MNDARRRKLAPQSVIPFPRRIVQIPAESIAIVETPSYLSHPLPFAPFVRAVRDRFYWLAGEGSRSNVRRAPCTFRGSR